MPETVIGGCVPPDLLPLGAVWPDRAGFAALASDGRRVIPVVRRLLADGETPLTLYRKLILGSAGDHAAGSGRAGTCLLESVEHGGLTSRYSIVGVAAQAILTADQSGQAVWHGRVPEGLLTSGPVVDVLRHSLAALATPPVPGLPPLTGGFVGSLAYDMVRHFEKLPCLLPDELGLPDLSLVLLTDLAVLDHRDGSVYLIANAINQDASAQREDQAYADARARLAAMSLALAGPVDSTVMAASVVADAGLAHRRTNAQAYQALVRQAKKDIRDGEIFQVVLAQRFDLPCAADPLDVYRMLRSANPSPYLYLIDLLDAAGQSFTVVGASPEALVTARGDTVVSHPIAGSRPRGKTADQDQLLAEQLLADEKERAEHVMLVDLARNDLARIAEPGTVRVVEFMKIERYSHIMHIVSTVMAQRSATVDPVDIVAAVFPAGTLSGAPKVRAMELIEQYEAARRGVYGGVVGYFDFAGNLDLAIAIRSAVLRDGQAYVAAGAGIVADSDPAKEDAECQAKAAAVIQAINQASQLTGVTE